jgi:choline dehydrogenase-like flavoprotein
MPIATLMHVPKPGHNAHSGGSFPMRENPGELETDRLGRPKGFRKVHVVDASIFPSMPATTVVLALMANAHRIASAYQET